MYNNLSSFIFKKNRDQILAVGTCKLFLVDCNISITYKVTKTPDAQASLG